MTATAAERRDRELLLAYADHKGRHDVEAALALCHPAYYYETAGVPGRIEGLVAAHAFYTQLYEVLPDYFGEFDGMAVDGDTGVAWGRFGGTSSLTGRRIDMPVTFVCTFRDGLLASDTGYFDSRTFYELLGAPHPADAEAADFVERFQAAWGTRDPERFAELIHDEVDALFPGMSTSQGKDGALEWLTNGVTTFPDVDLQVERWARVEDAVFIEWTATATAGGEPLTWHGCDRFTLRDGRGAQERVYFDTAPIAAALAREAA